MDGLIYVVDVETSGPNVFRHELLSFYVTPLSDGESLEVYVDHPLKEIEWGSVGSRYFSGYEREWREGAVAPERALARLTHYFGDKPRNSVVLAGHNVAFDYYFLLKLASSAGGELPPAISHRLLDTHSLLLALRESRGIPKSALKSLGAFDYFGVPQPRVGRHTAKADVEATKTLIRRLFEVIAASGRSV